MPSMPRARSEETWSPHQARVAAREKSGNADIAQDVPAGDAGLVDLVARIDLDAGIRDRDDLEAERAHAIERCLRERVVERERAEAAQVLDVEPQCVGGNPVTTKPLGDRFERAAVGIAPPPVNRV